MVLRRASGWRRIVSRFMVKEGMVPKGGLEPPRPKSLPPQGSASTNSATWAILPSYRANRIMVSPTGLEPAPPFGDQPLRLACLPFHQRGISGALRGTRTRTPFRGLAPEAGASTNSARRANLVWCPVWESNPQGLAAADLSSRYVYQFRHLGKSCFVSLPLKVVPGEGIEPSRIAPADFKSAASTNSATRANKKGAT